MKKPIQVIALAAQMGERMAVVLGCAELAIIVDAAALADFDLAPPAPNQAVCYTLDSAETVLRLFDVAETCYSPHQHVHRIVYLAYHACKARTRKKNRRRMCRIIERANRVAGRERL